MKILKLIILFLITPLTLTFAQDNFKWDEVILVDSVTKDNLYSKTKIFIADTWVSSNDVIQLDDKEGGVIVLKCKNRQNMVFQLNDHIWYFNYTVKLYIKDNKVRITIDEVYCSYARCQSYDWPKMPVADAYPEKKGLVLTGLSKEKYNTLMLKLKSELQSVVDSYKTNMVNKSIDNSGW